MNSQIEKLLLTAQAEINYLEKKTNSQLDDKTANAGDNNFTKYARDLDNIPGFYNGKKNGYAWCDMFVDWCFVKTFGVDNAKKMLCQGVYGAGTIESSNYYKQAKRWSTIPHIGDQIFFLDSNNAVCHTGLVENIDSTKVYTIEGNTRNSEGVIANGGCVAEKSYALTYNRIAGYGMPLYNNDDKEADTTVKVTYKAYKGGYLYEIPLESIERIEYFKSNGTSGETVSNAAKRIQWNGRYPDIICNAELFNMKTYAPASAVVDEGKAQLLNGTSGFGFIDHKTPKFSYNNNINAVDFIGGYPVLIHNGAKAFTTDPAGLSGNRARTALGLNATKFSIAVVPESSNDATLSDMANLFIQNGYTDAIGLDGGGSTAYQTNEFSYEQGRKVRGFICVWYKGGKGNKASQSSSPSVNPKPVTPTKNPPLKQDTSAKYGIKYTVKANGGLNIRDAQGTIITLLSNGSTVMWYGYYTEQYSMDGKWLYVKTSNGVTGYVSSKYLVR